MSSLLIYPIIEVVIHPLGSIPRRFSSERPNSLSQLARLTPSLLASLSNCSFSSGAIRIWKGGAFPVPLGFLSRLIIVDMCTPIALCFHSIGVHLNTCAFNNATPRSAGTHAGRLTTNDSNSIEVAMLNHTTHPQGRDSHNLNTYIWRFIALSTAQPRVIHIEATSEQEVRQQSTVGCVMVFTACIRQGAQHAQL
ncbi:host cell division inhibitor Icd-like protein [Escherichia coli]|nr:host cell division inhibitor Icd-like protein [Escherichia coli]